MRDIMQEVDSWLADNEQVALATVLQTWGSSPRRTGAKMAVTPTGKIIGSVSGGCVEGAVYEAGVDSLKTGEPKLLHFGVADETAWEVGMACGGKIDVFVKPLDRDFFIALHSLLLEEKSVVAVTIIQGSSQFVGREMLVTENEVIGSLGADMDKPALELARQVLAEGTSRRVMLDEGVEIFLEVILPPLTLVAVGGVHITIALVSLAKTLGYRTVVIDPRSAFGSKGRFPNVDQLITAWPQDAFKKIRITQTTAIAMLTHDPKLDDPAIILALSSPAFYVGALGSRVTQARRRERLMEKGLSEETLSRLRGPIGLDIEAQTPEEIALSIMAEIVALHNQKD